MLIKMVRTVFVSFWNHVATPESKVFNTFLTQKQQNMSHSTPLNVGDAAPNTLIKARVRDESVGGDNPFAWKDVHTSELFNGKRVVLFALPGGKLLIFLEFVGNHFSYCPIHLPCNSLHSSVQFHPPSRL